jgi:hypothetical protein
MDMDELMSQLGHQQYHVHEEDGGVGYVDALASIPR